MYLLWGIVLIGFGAMMLFGPKTFYQITQGWKNDSDTDPSHLFIISTRIGGVLFLLVGITASLLQFLK